MANPNTINYLRFQDISASDYADKVQFTQYWASGNYSSAISLLNQSKFLGKRFSRDSINAIAQGISTIESKYENDVPTYLDNCVDYYQTLIDNVLKIGEWSNSETYFKFNFVVYNEIIYMAIDDVPVGTAPDDTTYWIEIGLRGDTGYYGIDLSMQYAWNIYDSYSVNDLVAYENDLYYAKVDNIGHYPTETDYWGKLVDYRGKIIVDMQAPTSPYEGMIWLQTDDDIDDVTTTNGQFWRYDGSEWVELYSRTLASNVEVGNDVLGVPVKETFSIAASAWTNNTYTISNSAITDGKVVNVSLTSTTTAAIELFNSLTITASEGSITLTAPSAPTTSIAIIVEIW